jgi:hypothetical protein
MRSTSWQELCQIKTQNYVTNDGLSVSLSSCETPDWDPRPNFYWCHTVAGLMLWREGRFVVYNCCWPSPAQSFSALSPVGFITTVCCLKFEGPLTWWDKSHIYIPQEQGGRYTLRRWLPFPSSPTNRMATVKLFEPASTLLTDLNIQWTVTEANDLP